MEVEFRALQPWALLPVKRAVDRGRARAAAEVYESELRWVRARRVPELCGPWRVGQEIGWVIRSPVDVHLTPLDDVEVAADEGELPDLARLTGRSELWRRGDTYLALSPTSWLRTYQFRCGGTWESMFVPNGAQTAEWRLGWAVEVPERFSLLVLPGCGPDALEVPVGLLSARTLARMAGSTGMSIAISPREPVRVRRGDPIARLLLLHEATVRSDARYVEYGGGSADGPHAPERR